MTCRFLPREFGEDIQWDLLALDGVGGLFCYAVTNKIGAEKRESSYAAAFYIIRETNWRLFGKNTVRRVGFFQERN